MRMKETYPSFHGADHPERKYTQQSFRQRWDVERGLARPCLHPRRGHLMFEGQLGFFQAKLWRVLCM